MIDETGRRAELKLLINVTLLGICFTLFVILSALKPETMKNPVFALQLVLAIPLFLSSSFARSRLACGKPSTHWEVFGYLTFILGYSCLLNSTGILLSELTGKLTAFPYFFSSIFLAVIYSCLQVRDDRTKLGRRIFRDFLFSLTIIILGMLPALGVF